MAESDLGTAMAVLAQKFIAFDENFRELKSDLKEVAAAVDGIKDDIRDQAEKLERHIIASGQTETDLRTRVADLMTRMTTVEKRLDGKISTHWIVEAVEVVRSLAPWALAVLGIMHYFHFGGL